MRLKTRMLMYAVVAMTVIITMVSIRLWINYEATKAREDRTVTIEILQEISEVNYLNTLWLLFPSERVLTQWKIEYESLTSLLSDMKMRAPDERVTIGMMFTALNEIFASFNQMTKLHERQSAGEELANYQDITHAYITQILLGSQALTTYAKQLADIYGNKVATTQSVANVVAILLLSVTISFLVLFISTFLIYVLKPVLKLKQGANTIATGNLDYKIDIARYDEIGDVAISFNQMTTELKRTSMALQKERDTLGISVKERTDDLLRTNQLLLAEIAGRQRAEEEISKLNVGLETRVLERTAQLESANKEMEAFAYSVSHDLRAPLRGIDGWSLALLEDYKDKLDEQGRQYLNIVRSETQRMGRLIDDLLMFSRQARSLMEWEQLDITVMVQTIATHLQQQNPALKVDFIIQPGLRAQGDASLIEIVLNNLLGNALKFSSKNSHCRIEFGETEKDGSRVFFVRDNGVGFDMVYAQKLFGVFQRLHKSSEFPGTGIGLAIVRRIIGRHGGRIWAEAQVNKGATFYFTLKEAA